ncbi:hypothetical protein ABGB18_32535 [Nonomuraea sp. B12E4]|uniref:hypothetical protein n=1 Tax=Nonomuraea sp. B12E4 TaxID=3153564 RepID=UPI00325CBA16
MRSLSPRVTKLLFGALVVAGSLMAAAGVIFVTPRPSPAEQPATCPEMASPSLTTCPDTASP